MWTRCVLRSSLLSSLLVVSMLVLAPRLSDSSHAQTPSVPKADRGFIENRGQWPGEVFFLYESPGTALWFTRDGLVIDRFSETREEIGSRKRGLHPSDITNATSRRRGTVMRTRFVDSRPAVSIEGRIPLQGKHNFIAGDAASEWHAGVRRFSEVWYRELYEGIDVVFRCDDEIGVKYDVVVASGADCNRFRLRYEGIEGLALTREGDLQIRTATGDLLEERPMVFQERGGRRMAIEAAYRIEDQATLSFAVARYDGSLPLVIDPRLSWSTYLGGGGTDVGFAIAGTPDGGIGIAGFTRSNPFPTTVGAYDRIANGLDDAFVSRFDAGGGLIFSTLIGGGGNDYGQALASDAVGNLLIAGYTASSSFPTTPGSFDRTYGGGEFDAFVAKLSSDGSALLYSTFLGGVGLDAAISVVVDDAGNAIVSGVTTSAAFPTTPESFDPTYNGGWDAFITQFNSSGSEIVQSTFFGGSGDEVLAGSARGPFEDQLFIGGSTVSADFPVTPFSYDTSFNGAQDGFLAMIYPSKGSLGYATFIGGYNQDYGYGMSVDAMGRAMLCGETDSFDFPVTIGAIDTELGGGTDGYITKLNQLGSELVFSTYLGGNESFDYVQALVPGPNGSVFATGATFSSDFQVTSGPFGGTPYAGGLFDSFVTSLTKGGDGFIYSTCLGGSDADAGYGILLSGDSRVFATGYTVSPDYPTTSGSYDGSWNGGLDTYVTALPVITTEVSKVGSGEQPSRGISLSVVSPIRGTIDATVRLPRRGAFTLDLVDVSGRVVLRRRLDSTSEGPVDVDIDLSDAGSAPAAGLYFLRATSHGESASSRVILLR